MKKLYKKFIKKLPYVSEIVRELDFYLKIQGFRPGHYYSPIIDTNGLNQTSLNNENTSGIDLNIEEQLKLLNILKKYISEFPFSKNKDSTKRYFFNNNFYPFNDAIFLFGIIKHHKPKQIIEIGSGYSSALILDTNHLYFDNTIKITFIEPNPERLNLLLNTNDKINLIVKKVQEVPDEIFTSLQKNDILFIDSSHIAKTGSDLNHILFNILPKLRKGVLIHFHDIFYPFEYPQKWIMEEKRNWNENYFLKAFLMYNPNFKIILFNTFLLSKYKSWFNEHFPNSLKHKDIFGSIWLVKT